MLYIKKPEVIEAIQLTDSNIEQVYDWIATTPNTPIGLGVGKRFEDMKNFERLNGVYIFTIDSQKEAGVNDYICKDIKNNFYPCKPDIFEQTYDLHNPDDEHICIKLNKEMKADHAECEEMSENGQDKDCSECSCSCCLMQA